MMPGPRAPSTRTVSPKRAEQLRFLAGGGINTLFGLAIFPILLWAIPILKTYYMAGLLIAQVVSLLFAFCVQKYAVFRARGGSIREEFAKFSSFYLGIYVANWIVLPLLVEGLGWLPEFVQVGFVGLTVIGSYFWHRDFTFRNRREPKD
jgi:putative flippase GtrA